MKAAGLVLPAEAATTADAVTFPGFPGVWLAGEAKSFEALGLEEDEALDLVASLGLPLEKANADAPAERALARTGGLVSNAQAASGRLGEEVDLAEDEKALADWPKTHAELDQLAADYAFTWPDHVRTVADKQHALADANYDPPTVEEDEGEV